MVGRPPQMMVLVCPVRGACERGGGWAGTEEVWRLCWVGSSSCCCSACLLRRWWPLDGSRRPSDGRSEETDRGSWLASSSSWGPTSQRCSSLQQGRAASPARLRPAAHAFAEYALGINALGWSGGRRLSRRTARLLLCGYVVVVVVAVGVAVAEHLWRVLLQAGFYVVFYPVLLGSLARRRHRAARAALQANAAGAGEPTAGASPAWGCP